MMACLVSPSFAQVGRINVVGVNDDGTGMVIPLDVEIVAGKGRILITSVPFTGVDTQSSENIAVAAALNYTGQKLGDRDVIFVFNTNVTLVEGPSAGAAMALATISALQGLEIRDDAVVSGLITEDGSITLSGSLLQKAYASREKNLFLVGKGGTKIVGKVSKIVKDEEISLNEVDAVVVDLEEYARRHWGLKVIEIHNLTQALEIVVDQPEPERWERNVTFQLEARPAKENMLSRSAREFAGEGELLLEEMREFYTEEELEEPEGQLNKSRKYLGMGYEYSAANFAFLATIKLRSMKDQHEGTDWAELYGEIMTEKEIPDYGTPLHYVIGAQERYSWARNVADLMEEAPADLNGSYFNAELILMWYEIVDRFIAEVTPGEKVFSSEIVERLDDYEERAGEEIGAAEALGFDTYGAGSLFNAVETAKRNGWYHAGAYDAINAEGRAGSASASRYDTIMQIRKAGRSVEDAMDVGLGFWAEWYLENSMVALEEGEVREAHTYAFMADEYAKYDMYAAGIQVVERLPEPVVEERKRQLPRPQAKSFWDGVCEILDKWCWRIQ